MPLKKHENLKSILEQVVKGKLDIMDGVDKVTKYFYSDMGFATVDHYRQERCGFPEVIYCAGKTPEQVLKISEEIINNSGILLATRADEKTAEFVLKYFPQVTYNSIAQTITFGRIETPEDELLGTILVVSAGTSDLPVSEEALVTAGIMGNPTEKLYDVGVAGIHRLFSRKKLLQSASVVIVVAGMEGALASVVGGLVNVPVIGVPTSQGYGASFGGISALLGMLTSCASGVTVVNIDNGFGAGYAASLMNRKKRP